MDDVISISNLNDFILVAVLQAMLAVCRGIRMIIVSYDISDDKLRTKFSKYLSRFGHRLQYSVFEIDNSPRIVDNIVSDLKNRYEKLFSQCDSVMIFKLSSSCEVMRFGYAKNDEKDFFIIT